MRYFDINLELSEEDIALKDAARQFAEKEMRPVSRKLDVMDADAVIADDSPLWPLIRKAYSLGYHKMLIPEYYGGLGLSPLQTSLIFEELAWGSFGLALYFTVVSFPFFIICMQGDEDLIENHVVPFCNCTDGSIRGCWGITEPDHGSDQLAAGEDFFYSENTRCQTRGVIDGEDIVISGQKSAWVSGGTIATHTLLHFQLDPTRGMAGQAVAVVPLDLPGVSKGKALKKIGQRDLNQGELFFDDVRIPKKNLIATPDFYEEIFDMIINAANLSMSMWSVGLARAAFDEAFTYAKERVQGGKPLIEHYSMKQRLFQMFSRVETSRAISRAAVNLNLNISPPYSEYSAVAKTYCTQAAFENAHEAIQIHGGNGLTEEYIVEKLFRDARATLIEDGCNETLFAGGGNILKNTYPRPPLDF